VTAITPTAPEYMVPEDWTGSPFLHLKRVLVKFLKGLHAQCPVGAYRWDPDSEGSAEQVGSEVWIGMDAPINPQIVGDRPAITVLRGPGSFQGIGIGDNAFSDLRTGGQVLMDILPVTVTVNVLSRVPLEAEGLSWFGGKHIWALREVIMKGEAGIMFLGNRPNFSPPTPAGSLVGPDVEHNWVVCSVMFPCYLQTSVTRVPLNKPAVSGFGVTMTAGKTPSKPKVPVLKQGTAVLQPKIEGPAPPTDPGDIGPSLPPEGEDERQSTEPLEVRITVDKETA
jgi:hypothetical protein